MKKIIVVELLGEKEEIELTINLISEIPEVISIKTRKMKIKK